MSAWLEPDIGDPPDKRLGPEDLAEREAGRRAARARRAAWDTEDAIEREAEAREAVAAGHYGLPEQHPG